MHPHLCYALFTLIVGLAPCVVADEHAQGPNIVFILADDMGYGDARCYNPESKVPTPNIDKLAAQGMRFTDAHTPSSVCTPTRYGLLTGRYPWRSRIERGIVWFWDPPLIEDDRTTLPEMLRATHSQYATACFGKWHLGWAWEDAQGNPVKTKFGWTGGEQLKALVQRIDFTRAIPGGPLDHGFDRYFGDDVPNFPPYTFFVDDRLAEQPTGRKPRDMYGRPGPMAPGWDLQAVQPAITERAIEYIRGREQRGEPFFLYMPLNIPHTPIVPDEPYQGKSEAGQYGDFVVQVDAIVGRVMKALDEAKLADNTIVVFTSDNGSPARDGTNDAGQTHAVTEKFGHVPNAPWRGLKADIWEAGHRVPHIVRWPSVVQGGSSSNQLVCLVDWYATLAEIHGMTLDENQAEDSISMLGILRGIDEPIRQTLVHHSLNGTYAIRKGDWKLIEGNLGSGGFSKPGRVPPKKDGPQGQLYNLAIDPGETDNRWMHEPRIVESLMQELGEIRGAGRSR